MNNSISLKLCWMSVTSIKTNASQCYISGRQTLISAVIASVGAIKMLIMNKHTSIEKLPYSNKTFTDHLIILSVV